MGCREPGGKCSFPPVVKPPRVEFWVVGVLGMGELSEDRGWLLSLCLSMGGHRAHGRPVLVGKMALLFPKDLPPPQGAMRLQFLSS